MKRSVRIMATIVAAAAGCAISAALMVLAGCTAPVTIKIPAGNQDPMTVVFCALRDGLGGSDTTQVVSIARTTPYFDEPQSGAFDVSSAVVTVTDLTHGIVYPFSYNAAADSIYSDAPFRPLPNHTYRLDVAIGTDRYTATATGREKRLNMEKFEIAPMTMMGFTMYMMKIWGSEPGGRDGYIYRIAVDGKIRTPNLVNWYAETDELYDGSGFENHTATAFPSEPDERDPNAIWLAPGQKVTYIYSAVEPGFAQFVGDVKSSPTTNPLFGGPPYNVGTNIEGGAVGYFGVMCSSEISAVVPE